MVLIKRLKIFSLLCLWFLVFSIGCTEEENKEPQNEVSVKSEKEETIKPKITIKETPEKFFELNDSANFQLLLSSRSAGIKLNKFKIMVSRKSWGGVYQVIQPISSIKRKHSWKTGAHFSFKLKNTLFNPHDSVRVKFSLFSDNGKSISKSYFMVNGQLMTNRISKTLEKDFVQINHRFTTRRPPENKFDLYFSKNQNNIGYLIDGEGKRVDIRDNSISDSTFNRQWLSKTRTRFVKPTQDKINFPKPLDVRVRDVFQKGNASKFVKNISKRDLIIAKIRGFPRYVVIKITSVSFNKDYPAKSYIRFKAVRTSF